MSRLCYYSFAVHIVRCAGSFNSGNGLSNKVCVPNKIEDLNLDIFNRITGISESKTLTKHKSCECKCTFDGRKCNSDQKRNNNKCWCEYKNLKEHVCKLDYILNHAICSCENGKYLASISNNWMITSDEIIE